MSYASDALIDALQRENDQLKAENARLKQELEAVGAAAYLYGRTDLADENAKLREQTELLITLLRNDCDIEASWDGLRKFWSIELTEGGCLMRDRACKTEAENAKLREYIERKKVLQDYARLFDDNAKLRKLVHALLQCHVEDKDTCSKCDYRSPLHGGCMADVMADQLGIEEIK